MKKLLVCAALAMSVTTLHAASMSYTAFISCFSCVTTYLSWANEPFPVGWAEVDDSNGSFLFALNVGTPRTTGSIVPNPQTVSGLSSHTLSIVTNGQVGIFTPSIEGASIEPKINVFANLNLFDMDPTEGGTLIDKRVFIVSTEAPAAVPEPAAWSLTFAGMALLLFCMQRRRRNSQT